LRYVEHFELRKHLWVLCIVGRSRTAGEKVGFATLCYARATKSILETAPPDRAAGTREDVSLKQKLKDTGPKPRLPVVGWREWVALPQLGIAFIKPKIDTGARSSSLHASEVEEFERDGKTFVRFKVHPIQRNKKFGVKAEAEVLEYRNVKSSSGQKSRRPVILTEIQILGRTWPIELTLANRDEMGFRMLLGREAVRGRFLVDAGKSYYGGKPLAKRKKKPRKTRGEALPLKSRRPIRKPNREEE